jgi:phospholipase C
LRSTRLTRRQALKAGIGLGALAAAPAACGNFVGRCAGGPPENASTPPAVVPPLLAGIDTIVAVMMENRSFDHLFGALHLDAGYAAAARVDGLTGTESNPAPDGQTVPVSVMPADSTLNPLHDWASSRLAWNGGRNDGFVRVNAGPAEDQAMAYFARDQLPTLYALADQYTVCDRWYSSVMGPTWPNRFYLHAATSQGRKTNKPMGLSAPPTVWEQMAARCQPAKNYYAGSIPWYSVAFPAKSFSGQDAVVPEPIDRFFADAASGDLPSFALIDPDFQVNDGHPPHDLGLAEAFLGSIYRAMLASPQWASSLLVITFDEHGGFFDHVSPPTTADPDPDFRQLGFRVPTLIVGPTVRRGAVVSAPFEHVSILSTLRSRFGIASLGPRMDAAADLAACIDPALVPSASAPSASRRRAAPAAPPRPLPPAVHLRACEVRHASLRESSQPEMEQLAAAGRVPRHHLDPRPPDERLRAWLRHAQELEAVRVVG